MWVKQHLDFDSARVETIFKNKRKNKSHILYVYDCAKKNKEV